MDPLISMLAIIGGAAGGLAALAAGYVWVKRSGEIATIEAQERRITATEGENADLRRRVAALEEENARLHRAVAQVTGVDKVQATVDAIKVDTTAIRVKVAA